MDIHELHTRIGQFLAPLNPQRAFAFSHETNILETGELDFASLVQFVIFIETLANRATPIDEFMLDTVSSTAAIHNHYFLGKPSKKPEECPHTI